ncbi:ABC transporter permease [Fodinibacter luteus]|uniref:ABC transporter permease n=1 Tax=Fodinibacter luteus TaxID=552064 RepID=A0ABP8KM55_9MICO
MSSSTSAAAAEFARRRQSPVQKIQHLLHGHPWLSPLFLLVLTFVIFSILNPRFASPNAQSLLLQQVAVVACLAIGQTLVILTAGIDLSVGAITILAMMVMASLAADQGVPGLLAILIGIALAVGAGFLNGFLVTRVGLPPFIVTLGTLSIFTAIALLYSGGSSIQNNRLPDIINVTGESFSVGPFRVTVGVLMVLALYCIVGFALTQTAWGRHIFAVGDDAESARLSGVASKRILLSVYTVAGLIYGFAAWIQIGRAGSATANGIPDANLDSITAVVIGGTSLFGGRGGLIGSLLGALIVGSFTLGLSLAGVDQQWRLFAIGVLVIVAVSVDQWIRKVKA